MAGRQHDVVGLGDVRAAGLDKRAVKRRVDGGRLFAMFPRTWCVGHPPTTREAWHMSGVLAAGEDARLAAASACQQYDVFRKRTGRVHVVRRGAPARWGRLHIHSLPDLPPRRRRNGIPVVPIEEALLGLAADATVADDDVRRAIRQAQVTKLTDHRRLVAHSQRSKGRPGIRRFRALVGDRPAPTRSELEDAALAFLLRYGFDPRCNAIVDGREADFLLDDGTVIEIDSEGSTTTRSAPPTTRASGRRPAASSASPGMTSTSRRCGRRGGCVVRTADESKPTRRQDHRHDAVPPSPR